MYREIVGILRGLCFFIAKCFLVYTVSAEEKERFAAPLPKLKSINQYDTQFTLLNNRIFPSKLKPG